MNIRPLLDRVVLKATDLAKAETILLEKGVKTLSSDDILCL